LFALFIIRFAVPSSVSLFYFSLFCFGFVLLSVFPQQCISRRPQKKGLFVFSPATPYLLLSSSSVSILIDKAKMKRTGPEISDKAKETRNCARAEKPRRMQMQTEDAVVPEFEKWVESEFKKTRDEIATEVKKMRDDIGGRRRKAWVEYGLQRRGRGRRDATARFSNVAPPIRAAYV